MIVVIRRFDSERWTRPLRNGYNECMRSARRVIRSIMHGIRVATLAMLATVSLIAVTLWQQTRLPDEEGWSGSVQYEGRGSNHFYSEVCGVQTTTLYEKKSNLRRLTVDNRSVADQAHSIGACPVRS